MFGLGNGLFSSWWGNGRNQYNHFSKFWDTTPMFNDYAKDVEKLQMVFSNPAMLKVVSLMCDLFSLGEIYVYKDGKSVDKHQFLNFINNPNPRQSKQQYLWDFCFWNMIGNDYCYLDTLDLNKLSGVKSYFLEPSKIEWPLVFEDLKDKLFLSKSSEEQLQSTMLTYRYSSKGNTFVFPFKKLLHIPDLTNGTGNWFKGSSRIDALYKVLSNSEEAMDSKNINLRFSAKYMVSGKSDLMDTTKVPLTNEEKLDIETKAKNKEPVTALKSLADIKRFVENIANLKLDDSYLSDYFTIGTTYGIPKDVLEAFNSGTYENQEKARGALVSYCLQPRGNSFMRGLMKMFGVDDVTFVIDWEHLPFMQVFAKERAETAKVMAETLLLLMKAGIKKEEINTILDTNFTELDYEPAKRATTTSGQAQAN